MYVWQGKLKPYCTYMVTPNILRAHEGKYVFSEKKYSICDCPLN